MRPMRLPIASGVLPLTFLALAGCHNEPSAETGGVGGGASASAPATVSDKECPAEFTVDDMEDANNQVLLQKGRNGYWYTFVDKQGSTISPPIGSTFIMSAPGASGSTHAARMIGKLSSTGEPLFAGMGFSFTNPKGQYDAKAYSGVSFWAKVGPGSATAVRLKVPDVNTDPDGKVCTECFNDFGSDISLTSQWAKYTVPFASMKQMSGWGSPQKPAIDKSKIYGLQWQFTQAGATYDLWIDSVQLTGCP